MAVNGLKLLESYRGIVQCDGYAAYKTIADDARTGDAITLAFCWAHRRVLIPSHSVFPLVYAKGTHCRQRSH